MAMALLFIASLPISAFAENYNLGTGNITVEAKADGQYVTQVNGVTEEFQTTDTVIYQTPSAETDKSASISNTVTIKAEQGATAEVTLKDVNINASGAAAVSTDGKGDVTIELDGDNTVVSGASHAGVEKNNNGSLTITDTDNNGSLTAQGGTYGAGIGGGSGDNVTNITISGGKVIANGGTNGAGIGSGSYTASTNVSNIKIEGGEVKATGGSNAAGIGGGAFGTGTDITISGGTVEATGDDYGAGIGGGYNGDGNGITISGGTVKATGGKCGAGIGSGALGKAYSDTLTVSGDAEVKVQGGKADDNSNNNYGPGASIGGGGYYTEKSGGSHTPVRGGDAEPNVTKLTKEGRIECYAYDAEGNATLTKTIIGSYVPVGGKTESKTVSQTVTSYSVVDKDGKSIGYKTEVKDGVLTVTVDGDYAVLTGAAANISALTAQGIETVVFVTSGATSTFDLADLSAKGSGTYKLTHDGATVTFTLGTTDISEILK